MMILFFEQYLQDGSRRSRIAFTQALQLLVEVADDNSLDRYGRGRDRLFPQQAAQYPEPVAARRAHPVGAAESQSTPVKFAGENGTMTFFVRFEFR